MIIRANQSQTGESCALPPSRCENWKCVAHGPTRAKNEMRRLIKMVPRTSRALAITVGLDQNASTWQEFRSNYKRIFRVVKVDLADMKYLAVVEPSGSGKPHLHATIFTEYQEPNLRSIRNRIADASGISRDLLGPDISKGLVSVIDLPDDAHRQHGQTQAAAVGRWASYTVKNYNNVTLNKHLELNGGRAFHYSRDLGHRPAAI